MLPLVNRINPRISNPVLPVRIWVEAPHMRIKEEHARRSKVHHGSKHDEHTCKNRS